MDQSTISITINGKTHQLRLDDPEGIKSLPWEDRKQLIKVLEVIHQAEHVKKPDSQAVTPIRPDIKPDRPVANKKTATASSQDIDVLMSQLIIEDRKNQTPIPDRSVAIKWMLAIILVIIVLSLLF